MVRFSSEDEVMTGSGTLPAPRLAVEAAAEPGFAAARFCLGADCPRATPAEFVLSGGRVEFVTEVS
jgi:hypothetical protein